MMFAVGASAVVDWRCLCTVRATLGRAADDALLSPYLGRLDEIRILAQPRLTTSRAALRHYTRSLQCSPPRTSVGCRCREQERRPVLYCLCFGVVCLRQAQKQNRPTNATQRNATRRRAPVISHPPSAIRSRRQLHVKALARNSTKPPAPPPANLARRPRPSSARHCSTARRLLPARASRSRPRPAHAHAHAVHARAVARPPLQSLRRAFCGSSLPVHCPPPQGLTSDPTGPAQLRFEPAPADSAEHVCCCRFAGAWPAALPAVPPRATPLDRRVQHHEQQQQPSACWRSHAPSADLLPPLHQHPRRLESEGRGQLEPPAARA